MKSLTTCHLGMGPFILASRCVDLSLPRQEFQYCHIRSCLEP